MVKIQRAPTILKLTTDQIKEAEQKTKDLGLVVGEDSVQQAKQYKESLNDLKLVATSLEVQFGSAVLPYASGRVNA